MPSIQKRDDGARCTGISKTSLLAVEYEGGRRVPRPANRTILRLLNSPKAQLLYFFGCGI